MQQEIPPGGIGINTLQNKIRALEAELINEQIANRMFSREETLKKLKDTTIALELSEKSNTLLSNLLETEKKEVERLTKRLEDISRNILAKYHIELLEDIIVEAYISGKDNEGLQTTVNRMLKNITNETN